MLAWHYRCSSQPGAILARATLVLFLLTSVPGSVYSQMAKDVLPAVVFLEGNRGTEQMKLDGREVEIWIKRPDQKSARPLKKTSSGTGFIAIHNSSLYLVTAQHVAVSMPFDTKATLRGPHDVPLTFTLADLSASKSVKWVFHDTADVAVLPLRPPRRFEAAVKAVSVDQLRIDKADPDLDWYLTTVGFPLRLGTRGKFSPIVKISRPASGLFKHARFDNEVESTFFILDDPSVSGFSGAPVFKLPRIQLGAVTTSQGPFACVGLVHGTFSDPTGGKFAAIVPAFYIIETLNKAGLE